jgi:FMNH2-dependent dimethyl sulfone monooxygenase
MSAFAIVRPTTVEAESRLDKIYRAADTRKIRYFQQQIDANAVAHNKLDIGQTIEANLGLSARFVGDPQTVIRRLRDYESIGVDLIIFKFEFTREDALYFHQQVIDRYSHPYPLISR